MERSTNSFVRTLAASDLSKIIVTALASPKTFWTIIDQGVADGATNMRIDQGALDAMNAGQSIAPLLRFFGWSQPTITFGYLLSESKVEQWSSQYPSTPRVRRPTGGGAVFHDVTDLSFSLLWPRDFSALPNHPRDCYEAIHARVKRGLDRFWKNQKTDLYVKPTGSCEQPTTNDSDERFSVCFQEPVCNDVMVGGKKIVGGALRITKRAILYQGAVQIGPSDVTELKESLRQALTEQL